MPRHAKPSFVRSHIRIFVTPPEARAHTLASIQTVLATFQNPALEKASIEYGKREGQLTLVLRVKDFEDSESPIEDITANMAEAILSKLPSETNHLETGSNFLIPA